MHPKFEEEYVKLMEQMFHDGESIDSIKLALLDHRDEMLEKTAHKLEANKHADAAYVVGSTAANIGAPLSGLALTVPYVVWMCRHFAKELGIVSSKRVKNAVVATAESIFLEYIIKYGVKTLVEDLILTDGATAPVPGLAAIVMPIKWKMHRDHRSHMIHFILEKAKEYHRHWITEEIRLSMYKEYNNAATPVVIW
ncbi:hypothetical protein ACHAWU_009795 [Discostella pseudostelligera]|uniref:Uncharacterized protein n=1 Tax=Discostella pseudostelligera TaxID=259834 RepID=A0ABD3M7U1_9STRA